MRKKMMTLLAFSLMAGTQIKADEKACGCSTV